MAEKMVASGKWKKKRDPDSDSRKDMEWIAEKANEHSKEYNLGEISYDFTMGVVKNIIPAIPCSNAMCAASCTIEAIKFLTYSGQSMNNYMLVNGDGMSAVTHLQACSHNTWMRSLPLKSIVLVSENTTLEDFVNQIGTHEPTNNVLATYNIPCVSFDEDEEEEAKEESKQVVYILRTDTSQGMVHTWTQETVSVKVDQENKMTCKEFTKNLISIGSTEDDRFEYDLGSIVLVRVIMDKDTQKKQYEVLKCDDEIGPFPLPDGVHIVAIPRISCQTNRSAGVWQVEIEPFTYNIKDTKVISKTLKQIESETKAGLVIHGKPVVLKDSRLKDGRLTVYPYILETEEGKAFAEACSPDEEDY